jgi:hypothetical protein
MIIFFMFVCHCSAGGPQVQPGLSFFAAYENTLGSVSWRCTHEHTMVLSYYTINKVENHPSARVDASNRPLAA